MKYCSNCGKQIDDTALFCSHCGNACNNAPINNSTANAPTNDYLAIHRFYQDATTMRNYGIIAAILMFGIGIIFSIIILVKKSKIQVPNVSTTNPTELAELEDAKKRLDLGTRLAGLPFIAIGICIFAALIGSVI